MNTLGKIWLLSGVVLSAAMGDTLTVLAGEGVAPPEQHRKYLLLDTRVIERTDNARLVLGKVRKHPRNPLFGEDKPWEPRYDNMYPHVIYDEQEKTYKCWYTPFITSKLDEETPRAKRKDVKWHVSERMSALCYAVSKDGLKWEKPELGLIDFRGSKRNNIVMLETHGPGVVKDMREKDPKRRYKMFGGEGGIGPQHLVWFSPDGLHWSEPTVFKLKGHSDTHNNFFWDEPRQQWFAISRIWTAVRNVARTSSRDFTNWQPLQIVLKPRNQHDQLHDMVAIPYEGIYLGLIGVFDPKADRQWVELAWSPDTIQWHRVLPGTRLIPNGAKKGDYDWGCIFACQPLIRGDEIFIYYAGCNNKFFNWRDGFLCLATIDKDRWAGYRTEGERAGTVTTRPFKLAGGRLTLNTAARDGNIGVEVLDRAGRPIDGFSVKGCRSLKNADGLRVPVKWNGLRSFADLKGHVIRLRFVLRNATLYAFQVQP